MADKRSTALSLQENEELAEAVRTFPCLYGKSKKEYKDKNVVQNAWKEVADELDLSNKITLNRAISSYSYESIFQMNDKFLALMISSVNVHTCFWSF